MHAGWRDRTIDEVLVCRSGLRANLTAQDMLAAWQSRADLPDQRTAVAISALSDVPGARDRFVYSNLGYVLAGAVIDRLTGGRSKQRRRSISGGHSDWRAWASGPLPRSKDMPAGCE
jgi:CubicO group peptidase (beta-lactamase class C family)